MSNLLKLDRVGGELGLEACQEAIIRKVEQMVKKAEHERYSSAERLPGHFTNFSAGVLSRKNKLLREELEGTPGLDQIRLDLKFQMLYSFYYTLHTALERHIKLDRKLSSDVSWEET